MYSRSQASITIRMMKTELDKIDDKDSDKNELCC